MRVDRIDFFAVVPLAVDEGQKKTTWLRSKNILQETAFQVPLQHAVPAHGILTLAQRVGVAAATARLTRFLDLIVGRICKSKDCLAKGFAEFLPLRQQLEAVAFHE